MTDIATTRCRRSRPIPTRAPARPSCCRSPSSLRISLYWLGPDGDRRGRGPVRHQPPRVRRLVRATRSARRCSSSTIGGRDRRGSSSSRRSGTSATTRSRVGPPQAVHRVRRRCSTSCSSSASPTANTVLVLAAFVILLSVSARTSPAARSRATCRTSSPSRRSGSACGMVGLMQIVGNVTGFVLVSLAVTLGTMHLALFAVAIVELVTMLSVVLGSGKGMPPKPREGSRGVAIAAETWGPTSSRSARTCGSSCRACSSSPRAGSCSPTWSRTSAACSGCAGGGGRDESRPDRRGRVGQRRGDRARLAALGPHRAQAGDLPGVRGSGRSGRGSRRSRRPCPSRWSAAALFGAANGIFLAVDWALMTDIIPRASAGRYMGMSNVATGAATPFAVAIGGLVLDAVDRGGGDEPVPARRVPARGRAVRSWRRSLLRPVIEPRAAAVACARRPAAA